MTAADAAVVGVGNPAMGDDGLARTVLRRIADVGWSDDVRVRFAGTTALLALEALDGCRRGVVVDAIDATGSPGTVLRFPVDGAGGTPAVLMHDFGFAAAIDQCGGAYALPDKIVVVGAVPGSVGPGIELSDPIERAVPILGELVRAETVDRYRRDTMSVKWYCIDCDTEIDATEVENHESKGHSVRGRLEPDRLVSQDPRDPDGAEERD